MKTKIKVSHIMNKKFFLLVFLLLSTFAFSQTTVTLEDQCNCEVLSGTDVNAPGVSTPSGADIGDIYVNTNTGVIYFWDGNSWELTSTDNQQIQAFNFDTTTSQLTLTLENGGTSSVDLSSLRDAFSETLTTLVANADGTFTYTDEDGAATIIDIANLETLTSIALNADNTNIDYTDEDGTVTQLDLSNIVANLEALTTLVANADGTFTYTDEDGVDTVIDIANLETLTSIALNADNTNIDYTDEDGVVTQLNL
ncbi:MAG: hypothetical protein NWQ38_01155, partial [Cellulophaga sp.]|nr:hypothetical protein [Cellulophaga sp.]